MKKVESQKNLESVSGGTIEGESVTIEFDVTPDGNTTIDDVRNYATSLGAGRMDVDDVCATLSFRNAIDQNRHITRRCHVIIKAPCLNHGGHGQRADVLFYD